MPSLNLCTLLIELVFAHAKRFTLYFTIPYLRYYCPTWAWLFLSACFMLRKVAYLRRLVLADASLPSA